MKLERYNIYISVKEDTTSEMLSKHLQKISDDMGVYPVAYLKCGNGYILSFLRDLSAPFYIFQNKILSFVSNITMGMTTMSMSSVELDIRNVNPLISDYAQGMRTTTKISVMLKKQQEDFLIEPKKRKPRSNSKKELEAAEEEDSYTIDVCEDNYLLHGQLCFSFMNV